MRKNIRDIILAILSGTLLALSFPRYNLELLAWFAFVPLFFALKRQRPAAAFLLSYLCGVVFFAVTIYWLIHVTFLGLVLIILYLALYFGIFGFVICKFDLLATRDSLLTASSLWVLLEYLRSYLLTGFGWVLLGYSQYLSLPVIQIADITGVWGVSFIIMLASITIYQVLSVARLPGCPVAQAKQQKITRQQISGWVFSILCILSVLSYGYYNLRTTHDTRHTTPIKISVIQGNIPQELKWQSLSQGLILDRYISLSKEAAQDNPDLIIWPEASSPGFLGEDDWIFEKIFGLTKYLNRRLLLGTVVKEKEEYFNSAILVGNDGNITGRYDKIHLVPFGEYVPLKKIFAFLETVVPIGDFTAGKKYTLFSLNLRLTPATKLDGSAKYFGRNYDLRAKTSDSPHFSVLICFEDLFPELAQRFVRKGADFLVNITNDAWFGRTSSPYQHLSASVLRAVENRVFLLRAANTGVSGFINPKGEIISTVSDGRGQEIFISGYKTVEISPQEKERFTFYTCYGDVFVLLVCFWALYGIILPKRSLYG